MSVYVFLLLLLFNRMLDTYVSLLLTSSDQRKQEDLGIGMNNNFCQMLTIPDWHINLRIG